MGKSNQITRKIDPVEGSSKREVGRLTTWSSTQWTEVYNITRQVIPDIYYSFTEEGQFLFIYHHNHYYYYYFF